MKSGAVVAAPGRLPYIEFLRFILAFLVMIYHYFYFGPAKGVVKFGEPVTIIVPYFLLAVETFFIISGFVILFSAEKKPWPDFTINRFARLGPTLLICSTITYLAMFTSSDLGDEASLRRWMAGSTVLPLIFKDGLDWSLWSLRYEIAFYSLVAVAIWFGLTSYRLALLAYLMLGLHAVYIAGWFVVDHFPFRNYGAFFALGIFFYLDECCTFRIPKITWIIAIVTALLGCAAEISRVEVGMLNHAVSWPGSLVAGTVAIGILPALLSMRAQSKIVVRICTVVGRASFPLYAIHQLAGYAMINRLGELFPSYIITVQTATVALMIAFAILYSSFAEPYLMNIYRMSGFHLVRKIRGVDAIGSPSAIGQNIG